jgi:AAA15 family ATPase/GTPase
MLTSLKIENFKNFQEEQQLVFSNEDSHNFSILVGKNGAGMTISNL